MFQIKKMLLKIFGDNNHMNSEYQQLSVLIEDNPKEVIAILSERKALELEKVKLLFRAYMKIGNYKKVSQELNKNKLYENDVQLFNLYVTSLHRLKYWSKLIELREKLIEKNNTDSKILLLTAYYKTGEFKECLGLISKFQTTSDAKFNFMVFCIYVKSGLYVKALSILEVIAKEENENLFQWHDLTEANLKALGQDQTGWVAVELSKKYFKKRRFSDVVAILKPYLESDLSSERIYNFVFRYYSEALCNIQVKSSLKPELAKVLQRSEKVPSLSNFYTLYKAHLTFLESNLDVAATLYNSFDAAAPICLPSDKGALTVRDSEFVENLPTNECDIALEFHPGSKPTSISGTVTLVASDSKYFLLFHEIYSTSFFAENSGETLHFHIVNPSSDVRAYISKLAKNSLTNFSFSSVKENKNIKPYYAALRFLILNKLLNYYQCSILVTDIDVGFKNKISLVTQYKDNYDVLLKIR
ncbi:MAG: hypothetical protein ACJAS1_005804, partial [Oleiphilaceae bacterium]